MADELTYITDVHVAVAEALERRGLGLQVEVEFPPYRADIYLPLFHVVVEVDGPQHNEKADRKRNRELNRAYGLYVFHVKASDSSKPWKWFPELVSLLISVKLTRDERYKKCEMNAPWL